MKWVTPASVAKAFFLAALLFVPGAAASATGVQEAIVLDDSGAVAFLRLCRSPQPLKLDEIEKLLALPAYQRMIRWTKENWNDLDEEGWEEIFAAALMPEKFPLKKDFEPFMAIVEGIKKAQSRCDALGDRIEKFRESWQQAQTAQIIQRARNYLPEQTPELHFRLSLVVGLGQGGAYDSEVVLDISVADDPIERVLVWIAHESHHIYRNLLHPEEYVPQKQYEGIAQALFWLESEGIADMVTYDGMTQEEILRSMWAGWQPIYQQANVYLARLNDALKEFLNGAVQAEEAYSRITGVLAPRAAYHPVGFAMAQQIDAQLGRAKLVSCVGKPYKFLQAYQQAAKKVGDPAKAYVFDDEVVAKLAQLGWRTPAATQDSQ